MIEKLTRSSFSSNIGWSDFCRGMAGGRRRVVVRGDDYRRFSGAVCARRADGTQGTGAHAKSAWPEPRGAIRPSAADGGRHQIADQGRYCAAERRCAWCTFMAPVVLVVVGVHGLCGAAHGAQHGAGGYGRRPAVLTSRWARRRSCRSSWPAGRAATSIRCWARCAPWRR